MTEDTKTIRLILGDQLNERHSWFAEKDDSVLYILIEIRSETDYVRHHIQKVACIFAAMRRFSEHLQNEGHRVLYICLDDERAYQNFSEAIPALVEEFGAQEFEFQEADEYRLDRELGGLEDKLGSDCSVKMISSEHFLTERDELSQFFGALDKQRLMERFYRHMRKKHDVLMDGDDPQGDAWNFDSDNRNKYRGEVPIPSIPSFKNDLSEICNMLKNEHVETLGTIEPQSVEWPLDREQALSLLKHFCELLLPHFGRFQDAMTTESPWLFHSRLSFAMNVKLLSPREVIDAAIQAWEAADGDIDIAQIEGFVRQILGWREYMRGIYWERMPDMAKANYFGLETTLPQMYWTGETKMNCMRHSIGQSLDEAYAHHIQRLMITGNFALLAGIDPSEVDAWYLGIYIDAFEWVEMPNTRGMSQYADAGVVASKPYVASANYIHKMSNYCKDCGYDRTQKTGESSCPFNSLYWAFLERHRDKLGEHQRMRMMYRLWDKMEKSQRSEVLQRADQVLDNLDEL